MANGKLWTRKELEIVKEYYPDFGQYYCAKLINRTPKAIQRRAIISNIRRNRIRTGEYNSNWRGGVFVNSQCIDCGKRLKWGPKNKRCRTCYLKFNRGKNHHNYGMDVNGKKNPNYKDGRTLKEHYCKKCGKKITWQTAIYGLGFCYSCSKKGINSSLYKPELHKPNYCIDCGKKLKTLNSKRCYSCSKKKEKNSSWIDGRSYEPYPPEFNDQLKKQIKQRDNFTCQLCGTKKMLAIHHIDYDKKNCNSDNLITLCRSCNVKVNYERVFWIGYFLGSMQKLVEKVYVK